MSNDAGIKLCIVFVNRVTERDRAMADVARADDAHDALVHDGAAFTAGVGSTCDSPAIPPPPRAPSTSKKGVRFNFNEKFFP